MSGCWMIGYWLACQSDVFLMNLGVRKINTITDVEKQILVEAAFANIWNQYAAAIEMGLLIGANPRIKTLAELSKPKLTFVCKGVGRAGTYYTRWSVIEINTAYIGQNLSEENKTTIAHEIAHHLVKLLFPNASQYHGPEFRQVMASIGYSGDTYHSMSVREAKAVASKTKKEAQLFDLS